MAKWKEMNRSTVQLGDIAGEQGALKWSLRAKTRELDDRHNKKYGRYLEVGGLITYESKERWPFVNVRKAVQEAMAGFSPLPTADCGGSSYDSMWCSVTFFVPSSRPSETPSEERAYENLGTTPAGLAALMMGAIQSDFEAHLQVKHREEMAADAEHIIGWAANAVVEQAVEDIDFRGKMTALYVELAERARALAKQDIPDFEKAIEDSEEYNPDPRAVAAAWLHLESAAEERAMGWGRRLWSPPHVYVKPEDFE